MNRTIVIIAVGLAAGFASYRLSFTQPDPVAAGGSIDSELRWMKTELHLTDTQLHQLRTLHEASEPRLRALGLQVAQLRQEFAAIEDRRRRQGEVDFLKLGRFVEARRHVRAESLAFSRQLVLASAEVMDADQRQRYLGFVSTAIPLSPDSIR